MNNQSTTEKIRILFLGHDYFGGQFLKTILENHSDKIEIVGVSTNLINRKVGVKKKLKKARTLIKKNRFLPEFKEKIFLGNIINRKLLKNSPPTYADITVAELARQYDLPMFDASEIYNSNVNKINEFNADYTIIASFGKIPESVYQHKPHRFINFHPSLLPELRGGCPVFTAMLRKMPHTGFSFHLLSQKFDAGPLLYQEEFKIHDTATCREVEIAIAQVGANKLHELIMFMEKQSIVALDISRRKITHCMKAHEINARLSPQNMSTDEFLQKVKACSSWMLGSAYIRKGIRHFYIPEANAAPSGAMPIKKRTQYKDEALFIKTADGNIVVKTVYYKQRYYYGQDLLQLKGIMY